MSRAVEIAYKHLLAVDAGTWSAPSTQQIEACYADAVKPLSRLIDLLELNARIMLSVENDEPHLRATAYDKARETVQLIEKWRETYGFVHSVECGGLSAESQEAK